MTTRRFLSIALLASLLPLFSVTLRAEDPQQNSTPTTNTPAPQTWLERWQARTTAIQSRQPGWSVPVFAPYPMLIQVFRADFYRQITPARTDTWNFGGTKGLNVIPFQNTEFDIYYPPYIQHNSAAKDGFGDMSFVGKYRIVSGNQTHGNFIVSALLISTIPTGSYKNGSTDATINPTLAAGKGWRKFDVQSTLGSTLPLGDTSKLGRPVIWNVTGQYHAGKFFWPEIESNATYFHGGPNDGKTQEFLTPGLMYTKYRFHPRDPFSRTALSLGTGMQIATSSFHSYNHQLLFTVRFLF